MIKFITKIIGVLALTSGMNSAFAEQIQFSTTIKCDGDCKKACEALGRDHTWNPRQRTCTKRRKGINIITPNPPAKEALDSLSIVTQNAKAIHKELNVLFSNSNIIEELGLQGTQINSVSITLKKLYDGDPCATCVGAYGVTAEICCSSNVPICNDPCRDGDYVPTLLYSK